MKILLLIIFGFLFLMVPVAADHGSLEINADIPSVPVYIDDEFWGLTPADVPDLPEGYYLVRLSPE